MARKTAKGKGLQAKASSGAAPKKKKKAAKASTKEAAPAKKKAKRKSRAKVVKVARLKASWGVFTQSMKRVATFEYADRKQAVKKAEDLSGSQKSPHFVQLIKEEVVADEE